MVLRSVFYAMRSGRRQHGMHKKVHLPRNVLRKDLWDSPLDIIMSFKNRPVYSPFLTSKIYILIFKAKTF